MHTSSIAQVVSYISKQSEGTCSVNILLLLLFENLYWKNMGKGKIIIPIAVIVTIVIASVASYYLYQFLSGSSNGHPRGHASHLRSEVNQLSSGEGAALDEPVKKACDISPGIRVQVSGETEEVFGDGGGDNDDDGYYNSNDNPEDNQVGTTEGLPLLPLCPPQIS